MSLVLVRGGMTKVRGRRLAVIPQTEGSYHLQQPFGLVGKGLGGRSEFFGL
jgi:hypothetical protein